MKTPYQEWAGARAEGRYFVAVAWMEGSRAAGSNFRTDGRTLWSYGHVVGITDSDDRKVAYNCLYSVTTAKQVGPAKAMAHEVIRVCPSCRRTP